MLFNKPLPQARLTQRVLAHLLRYPDAELRAHVAELRAALRDEAALKSFLRQAPANFLALRPARDGLAARIHRQLRATPPAAWPDFASLARQLHLSPATLRRRLAQEGQSYRRVQEAARQALAMTLLANRALSLAEVASALGFAETSAFCRAFKRWTGQRPGNCRP